MPHEIGFVQNVGVLAHYMMLDKIKTFAEASGFWEVLRYDTTIQNRELILKGQGYSGDEEIFIGFRTYQSVGADYYNLTVAGFTGYVSSNTFEAQPGAKLCGVPAHNNRIDYWLTVNQQRIAIAMKVGTPVYECGYAGFFFPAAAPSQYPYPLVVGGMLNGEPATRFSDTSHGMPYKGNRTGMNMFFNDGLWKNPECYPWNSSYLTGTTQLRDTGGEYPFHTVELMNAQGIYGWLDGICHVPGFNNSVENTITISGDPWIVIQDVSRTGFADYFLMRMDS